jgi:hypothetical protein
MTPRVLAEVAGTVVAMVSDHRNRIRMPTATLGGPVVSRIGLGLAASGRCSENVRIRRRILSVTDTSGEA